MKHIILIEDSFTDGRIISSFLKQQGYEVIWYQDFETALGALQEIGLALEDIKAMIFDYCLDREQSSVPLVEIVFDLGFSGPMIANSSDEDYNAILQEAGCTHVRPGNRKIDVVDFLHKDIFGNN